MSPQEAKQAIENNPRKADRLAAALRQLGVQNPNQTVQQQPRQAARQIAGVLAAGNTSANGSTQNNSSVGGGQVQLRKCSGGGFIDSAMCKASNALFGWVIGGVVDFVQGIITGIVNMIFGFSLPKHNGQIAIFQQPTNQPWKGLYNSWLTKAVPIGIIEWILMILGIMFMQVFTSDASKQLELRELRSRSWKVLLGILGSWAMGAIFLFVVNGVILTIAPDGQDIASNLAVFTGSVGAAGAAGLLIWFFEGILFLFVLLLVLVQKASVFVLMWGLPVMLPLAAFDFGIIKYFSKPARGIIDLLTQMVFVTLPMALVLTVGYVVVNSLNQTPIAQIGMWVSGANTALILGFWILAAVSPLFVFSKTGRMKGMAAGLLGISVAANAGSVKEKVENAKERVNTGDPPPNVNETTDINPDGNDGEFGGALPNWNEKPSMLEAGLNQDLERAEAESSSLAGTGDDSQSPRAWASGSTTPETSEAGDPELPPGQPLPGGEGSSASESTDTRSATNSSATTDNPVVSRGDVTQVKHPRNLPSETDYQVGRVKDNGEFQPIHGDPNYSRSGLVNNYSRLNTTRHYEDEKLLLRSKDNGSYFDMDSITYREQSYEQMSRDTSEDVLNS